MARNNQIQIRRGADGSVPTSSMVAGEPLFSTDNAKLYIATDATTKSWVGATILDQDDMSGNSATSLATQQSIKAYVDAQVDTADALSELADTAITSPADATLLLYDTGTSTWRDGAMSGDATITDTGAVTIAADAVSNTKLENITRGSVKVGGGSDAPTDLNAKTSGQILVGDGTDIASVAVSGDIALAANGAMTIQANSVALTTDTTGDYVGTITGGVGVDSTAATSGEGTTHTLSLDLNELSAATMASGDKFAFVDVTDNSSKLETIDDVATLMAGTGITASSGVLAVDAAQAITSVTGDFTVTGDLTVSGDTVTTNVATVSIEDPLVSYANGNTGNAVDIGFYGKYRTNGTDLYLGLVWNADQTEFILFEGNQAAPSTTVNIAGTGYALSDLRLGAVHAATLDGGTY